MPQICENSDDDNDDGFMGEEVVKAVPLSSFVEFERFYD